VTVTAPSPLPYRTGRVTEISEDEVTPDDRTYWSVTTLLDILAKDALLYWMRNTAIDTLLAVYQGRTEEGAYILQDGPERIQTTDLAKVRSYVGSRMYRRTKGRSATQVGTEVHDAMETWALEGHRPVTDDEISPYLDALERDWLLAFRPSYEAAEMTVVHETWGYAGTLDAIVTIGGKRYIVDYKSGATDLNERGRLRGPYPEAALQLAAYRHAELSLWNAKRVTGGQRYYVISPEARAAAVPMPDIAGGFVIQTSPERARVHPVACGPAVHAYFGHVLELASWAFVDSRNAIHPPLIPPPI
jgi:PD-(D/E)XK nuclease superfamily protein